MIPFPGESLAIFDATDIASLDFTLGGDVIYRGAYTPLHDGHRVIAAGEEWRAWVGSGDLDYLETPYPDMAISWAVEVLSGTVTLDAAEGIDPDYGDPTLVPSTSLGTYTVTGPATLVIPSTATLTQVLNEADDDISFMLQLVATSGSADIQQVKLRVWPTTGAVGGWSDVKPSWSTTPSTPSYRNALATATGSGSSASAAAAWDTGWDNFAADVASVTATQNRTFSSGIGVNPCYGGQQLSQSGLSIYTSDHTLAANLFMITGRDWRTTAPIDEDTYIAGVDWIRPPNEVEGDFQSYAQQTGDGATAFLNAGVTISLSDLTADAMPGGASVYSFSDRYEDQDTGSTVVYDVPVVTAGAVISDPGSTWVSLDTGDLQILVTISHTMATGDGETYPGWTPSALAANERRDVINYTFEGSGSEPIQTYAVMPPYRYWSPVAGEEPLRLMQRGDGLGMGSGRVLGIGTRQGSIRVFGSV